MLKGIPAHTDYVATAKILHRDAWSKICDVLWHEIMEYDDGWRIPNLETDERDRERADATLSMLSAVILAFTGFEHLLRAEVVKFNPYLLIVRHPKEWAATATPKDFCDINSIEAKYLPRLVNEVSGNPLSPGLIDKYQEVRSLRNRAVHSHNGLDGLGPQAARQIGRLLLELYVWASHGQSQTAWLDLLREDNSRLHEWVEHHPNASVIYDEFHRRLVNFACVEALCTSAKEKAEFLGLFLYRSDASRRYYCPGCCMGWSGLDYAHLKPGVRPAQLKCDPEGWPFLYCHSCQISWPVIRRACTASPCRGDVMVERKHPRFVYLFPRIDFHGNCVCMTCMSGQDGPLDQ